MKTKIFAILLCLMAVLCIFTLAACDEETECTHAAKQWVDAVSATCTADGTVGHYVCPDCHEKLDADGNKITDLTVKKGEHVPATEWSAADGKHYHACVNCDAKLDETECSGGTATCTERAKCSVCQNSYGSEPAHTPVSVWNAADGKHYHACANCSTKLDEAECSGGTATCTERAKCSVCQSEYGPEPSHKPVAAWSVADGKHYHACENCSTKLDEAECSGGTATCTERAKCSVCQNAYGPEPSHKPVAAWSVADGKHYHACENCSTKLDETKCSGGTATCTKRAKCSVCDNEYGDFAEHKKDISKYDEEYHWMECACGEKGQTSPHDHSTVEVTPPTCTEGGYTTYTCSCGHFYKDNETNPREHQYSHQWEWDGSHHWHESICGCEGEISDYKKHNLTAVVTEPTCTAQGFTVYICDCGYRSEATDFVPETGHSVSQWNETNSVLFDAKKCEYTVHYSGECGTCGETVTKTKQIERHSLFASATTPATCKTQGEKSWFCSSEQCVYHNVAHHTELYTDANAHVWVVNEQKSTKSLTVYKCRDCDATKTQSNGSSADISSEDMKDMSEIELSTPTGGSDQNIIIGIDQQIKDNLVGKDVNISAGTLDDEAKQNAMAESNLNQEEQKLLEGCTIYDFTLTTSQPVSELIGWATIRIPYTLQPGDDPGHIIVWYINRGKLDAIEAVYEVDANGKGYVTFQTNHFSYYTVGQIDPAEICKRLGKHDENQLHVIAPTCNTGGYTVCLRCGEQVEGSAVPALGHTLNAKVETPATCTKAGLVHYTCANCDLTYDAAIAAIGHYHVLTEQITATCQTVGSTTYTCVHCSDSYTMTTPKLNHAYHTVVVESTCEANGYTEKTCTQCGNVVKVAYTKAVGHTEGTVWYQDQHVHYHICVTCGEKLSEGDHTPGAAATETTAQICTVCEYTIAPPIQHVHVLTKVDAVHATCTESGNIEYYICACGTWFADADAQLLISDHASVIVDAKGHTVVATPYVEPTCEEAGYTAGVWCSACETYLRGHVMISAYGHDYHQIVKAPTCTEQGSITYRCAHCGDTEGVQGEVIDAMGHNLTETIIAPTCTESGYTAYACTRCDYHGKKNETAALEHNYSTAYLFNETGHYHSCIRCDAVTQVEAHVADYPEATEEHGISCVKCNYKMAEAIAHTHKLTHIERVEPTCESAGNIEYYMCVCGEWFADEACTVIIYNRSDVILQATGHKLVYRAEQQATCKTGGYTAGIQCETCLAWKNGHEEIKPLGHAFYHQYQYDKDGHWILCERCGVPSNTEGHMPFIEVTEPTCTTEGYTTYVCHCGYTYTDNKTEPLGHAFGEWLPMGNGQHMHICANDASHKEVKSCEYVSEVIAPTCEKDGYTKYTCKACGHTYKAEETKAYGHDYGEWMYDGKGGHVLVCKNDASHNQYEVCVLTETVYKPTCTETGYTQYTCEICKNSYSGKEIPALGHVYGEWMYDGKGGHVHVCKHDSTHSEYEACVLTETVYKPTCTENGYTQYTCEGCKYSYIGNEVASLGHNFIDGTCENCGDKDPMYSDVVNEEYRTKLLSEMSTTWKAVTAEYAPSLEQSEQYTELRQAMRTTDSQTELQQYYNEFWALVTAVKENGGNEGDETVDETLRQEILSKMNMKWADIMAQNAATAEQQLEYDRLCNAVVEATSDQAIKDLYDEFLALAEEIENSQTPEESVDEEYRNTVYNQFYDRYRALSQGFALDATVQKELNLLVKSIKTANTYTELNEYCARFEELAKTVISEGDEISLYRYSVLLDVYTRWTELKANGFVTPEYLTEYNQEILPMIRGAVSIDEINTYYALFEDLVRRMEEGGVAEDDVDEDFRMQILTKMDALWENASASGWIISEDESERMSQLHGAVKAAKSNEEIQKSYDEFLKIIEDIEKDNQTADETHRESVLKMMQERWAQAQASGWIISESNTMRFDSAYTMVQTASTNAQIEIARNDFETMMAQIESENQNLDEAYRKQSLTDLSRQYKILKVCFVIPEEELAIYQEIQSAVKAATSTAQVRSAMEDFDRLMTRWMESADPLSMHRYNMLTEMYYRWTDIQNRFNVSSDQSNLYNELYNSMIKAVNESEINDYYDQFNMLVNEISTSNESKVDEIFRSNVLAQMHNEWQMVTEIHTATEDQKMIFDQLIQAVHTATSNERIERYYQQFCELRMQVEQNNPQEDAVDEEFRQAINKELLNHYKALINGVALDSGIQTRLSSLRKSISEATTQTELNQYVEEFYMLEQNILEQSDELSRFRYTALLDMYIRWAELQALGFETPEYKQEYNEILNLVKNAMTMEEIQGHRDHFEDLVYRMTGAELPTVDEIFRDDVLSQMRAGFDTIKASDWKISEEDNQYLNDLYVNVKNATTNEEIQMFFEKFNIRMKQIESENQGGDGTVDEALRQSVLSKMNTRWADIMAQNAATMEQQMRYDSLCNAVMEATSDQEIEQLYSEFKLLANEIEYGETPDDGSVDEKERQERISEMRNRWKIVTSKYTVSEDSALYAEQLMAKVQNALTKAELEQYYSEFMNLVSRIENSGSESVDRKQLLEEMYDTWNAVNAVFPVTTEDYEQFNALAKAIRQAATDDEVLMYYNEYKALISRIENGGSDAPSVDEAYRKEKLSQMRSDWKQLIARYDVFEEHQWQFDEWINRVQNAKYNDEIEKYYYEFSNWLNQLEKELGEQADRIEDAWLDQHRFTATVGTDVQQFIMETIVGTNLNIRYSQSGLVVIPVTYEMIRMENEIMVFDTVGNYFFYIEYVEANSHWSFGITVTVQPDMSSAKLVGEYTIAGALVGSSEDWLVQLYDNGLAMMAMPGIPESQEILSYTLEGTLLHLNSDGIIMVMQVNEETHTAEMYQPTGDVIGTYYYYDVMFQMYGPYTGAGNYLTVMTQMGPDGTPVRMTLYMTLDLENRTVTSPLFNDRPMTFDENGNLECRHEYSEDRREPSCMEPGYVHEYCIYCGNGTYYEISALGHDFDENGICRRCGCSNGETQGKQRYLERMNRIWDQIREGYGIDFLETIAINPAQFNVFCNELMNAPSMEDAQQTFVNFLNWIEYIHRVVSDGALMSERSEILSYMDQEWMILNDEYGQFIMTEHIHRYENLTDIVRSTTDRQLLVSLYENEFQFLLQEVRELSSEQSDVVRDFYLEQNRFELTEGHDYDIQSFIEKYVIGMRVYVLYEQAGLMSFPITWDMISYEMKDISEVGEYRIEIYFNTAGFGAWMDITLVVQMDMSKANVLGSYACDMSCVGENVNLYMEIYDNGYAIVTVDGDDSREIFPCRIDNGMIYLELGTGVYVLKIDGESIAHMYMPAEETPIVGTYSYEYLIFTVYGPYTGAGEYVAVISMNNGRPYWMTQLVTLDLDNRTIKCGMFGGTLVIDENGKLSHQHEYEVNRCEPTCTESGFEEYYCKHCGECFGSELAPLGHLYVDGVCERCGCMEQNEMQQTIEQMLVEMEWQWNCLWNDYAETNMAMLESHRNEYAARYESVKEASSVENAQRNFDAFMNMVDKIRNTLGEPMNGELERTRQELLNNMATEWEWLTNEVGLKIIRKYLGQYNDLVNQINGASDIDTMQSLFHNEFRDLMEEVRRAGEENRDYVVDVTLDQRRFELTEGHGYDLVTFIENNIIGKMLYVEYSQSGIVGVPITWEMIDFNKDTDISLPGKYDIGVCYSNGNFGTWQSVQIVVWMDMSKAVQLGTYSCDLSCMGEEDVMTMEIYNNGYAFVYFNGDAEDRELCLCEINGNLIYLDTGDGVYVMEIEDEKTAHMYEASEKDPVIGVYTYEDEMMITVYGTYEGAGMYIAKAAIIEDGEMFWLSLLVELDLDNRTILCEVFSSRPISFDENGNLLDENSDEEMEGDSNNSGDVEVEMPIDPPADLPDYDDSYGEIVIVPSNGSVNGDYIYSGMGGDGTVTYLPGTTVNGTTVYVPSTDGYVYQFATIA